MSLKENGRFYELPISGNKILEIVYNGLIRLVFNDLDKSYLDFHGSFEIEKYNQTNRFFPKDKDALILFYDLFDVIIKEAKADKLGQLYLTFNNGTKIFVEDGPYENWHYSKINSKIKTPPLHVHGGVGKIIF